MILFVRSFIKSDGLEIMHINMLLGAYLLKVKLTFTSNNKPIQMLKVYQINGIFTRDF